MKTSYITIKHNVEDLFFLGGGDIWSSACRRSRREFFDDDDGYRETGIRGHNNSSPLPTHDIILGTINQFTTTTTIENGCHCFNGFSSFRNIHSPPTGQMCHWYQYL